MSHGEQRGKHHANNTASPVAPRTSNAAPPAPPRTSNMASPAAARKGEFTSSQGSRLSSPAPAGRSTSPIKHYPITPWLRTMGLEQYDQLFSPYKGVEELLNMTEAEIRDVGIRNGAHRARITHSLLLLRDKLHQAKHKPDQAMPYTSHCQTAPPGQPVSDGNYRINADYATVQIPYQKLQGHTPVAIEHTEQMELSRLTWYHGAIPRPLAERLVSKDGDYLVRESTSMPGDFVLTSHWNGAPLHFVINKNVSVINGHTFVQYQFEENLFPRVPQLIDFYVGNRKPISEASGAIIFSAVSKEVVVTGKPPNSQNTKAPHHSRSASGSPSLIRRILPRRVGSQPLLSLDNDKDTKSDKAVKDKYGSLPSIQKELSTKKAQKGTTTSVIKQHQRTGSEPSLVPRQGGKLERTQLAGSEGELCKPAPPKPCRVPSVKKKTAEKPQVMIRKTELYDDDSKDYSDYDQVKSWPDAVERTSDILRKPLFSAQQRSAVSQSNRVNDYQERLQKAGSGDDYDIPGTAKSGVTSCVRSSDGSGDVYDIPSSSKPLNTLSVDDLCDLTPTKLPRENVTIPDLHPNSKFDPRIQSSELLMPNNRPLEGSALATIRSLLVGSNARLLALHITYLDMELLEVRASNNLGLAVRSGLELLTLPQGKQLRTDTLERFQDMALFVATSLLTCLSLPERARLLNQWIQTALELHDTLGNLYGFSAVMEGLSTSQIIRLKNTWNVLKESYEPSSNLYVSRLCGIHKSLNAAAGALPLHNITIPHIVPLADLLERSTSPGEAGDSITPPWLSWDDQRPELALDILLAHLDTARVITNHCSLYRAASEAIMGTFTPDKHLLQVFQTETHQKLLWGFKGCGVLASERFEKYKKVLSLLSDKTEPVDLVNT